MYVIYQSTGPSFVTPKLDAVPMALQAVVALADGEHPTPARMRAIVEENGLEPGRYVAVPFLDYGRAAVLDVSHRTVYDVEEAEIANVGKKPEPDGGEGVDLSTPEPEPTA